jgi:hypothetical protein
MASLSKRIEDLGTIALLDVIVHRHMLADISPSPAFAAAISDHPRTPRKARGQNCKRAFVRVVAREGALNNLAPRSARGLLDGEGMRPRRRPLPSAR